MSSVYQIPQSKLKALLKIVKERHTLVFDPRVWPKCTSKEVEQWSWRYLKNKKYLAHFTGKTLEIIEVG